MANGVKLKAGHDVNVSSLASTSITSVQDSFEQNIKSKKYTLIVDKKDTVRSKITAGNDVNITATLGDVTLKAAEITAGKKVTLAALNGDVNILANKDVNFFHEVKTTEGGIAAENNALLTISILAAAAAAYAAYEGNGSIPDGLGKMGRGEDDLSKAINSGVAKAVEISAEEFPEAAQATVEFLGEVGDTIDATIEWVDDASGEKISGTYAEFEKYWNKIPQETRDQIGGIEKIVSTVALGAGAVKTIQALKTAQFNAGKIIRKNFDIRFKQKFETEKETETAWKVYNESNLSKEDLVIGRLDDTAAGAELGMRRLDIPNEDWSPSVNDAWLQGGIDAKKKFYLGSNADISNYRTAWDHLESNRGDYPTTVFFREMKQLRDAGYRMVGNDMIPPN